MIDVTVKRALELAAARGGEQPAIHFEERVLSFREWDQAANRIANALAKAGLVAGDRVAVVMPNCSEYIAIAMACAKARFVMLAVNYRFTADEYSYQMSDAGAKALIYDERFAAALAPAVARIPGLLRMVRGQAQGDAASLAQVLASGDSSPVDGIAKAIDLFYLGYTSGTTGKPKGAMVAQGNRALAYHYWSIEYGLTARDHGLHCGPFHHTAPFSFTLTQLFLGGQVTVLPLFDAKAALAAMTRNRITWSYMVPFMLDRIVELGREEIDHYDLSSLRMLISGGSALTTRTKELLLALFPKVELHEFYGATEAGVITNLRPQDQQRKTRCVGRSVFDTEVQVRREDGITLCDVGEVGDIWMRGPTIFSGYFNDPVKTAEVFDGDWCTIGDVGRFDEEGYLYIVDRRKDVIKSGGVNVFPAEIEEVLLAHKAVLEAAVVGTPHPTWGEAVHGVIVLRPGHQASEQELAQCCRAHLAGYKVPKSFEFRTELPRNANGKVLKRVLRDQAAQRAGTGAGAL